MSKQPKILIVDTLYDDFIKANPINPAMSYESNLQALLYQSFGTFDAYSRNLRALGWDAVDIIANHEQLQYQWATENHMGGGHILSRQIEHYDPDIVFLQDLSLHLAIKPRLLAAQLSCPWPGDEAVKRCDVVFSSFPHFIPRIEALGVRAVYNPLAFDPIVLERCGVPIVEGTCIGEQEVYVGLSPYKRIYDCVFIGGVGAPSHWKRGMETLEAVAKEIPTFKWWGYGYDTLPASSALRDKYQGEAWGLDMYRIMLQSKIVLNRHGEVAQGYANNMRMFEATGCGAMLLTEDSPNLYTFFADSEVVRYTSPAEACAVIRDFLRLDDIRRDIAAFGQARTLRDHTYSQRMRIVSETLQEMLCAQSAH